MNLIDLPHGTLVDLLSKVKWLDTAIHPWTRCHHVRYNWYLLLVELFGRILLLCLLPHSLLKHRLAQFRQRRLLPRVLVKPILIGLAGYLLSLIEAQLVLALCIQGVSQL